MGPFGIPEVTGVPDWLQVLLADTSALQLVFWIGAIGALIAVVVKVWPALSQFVEIINATAGLPDYIKRADDRHKRLESKVDGIYHETHNNDGSSVKDAVDRIEKSINEEVKPTLLALAKADDDLWEEIERTQSPEESP